MVKLIECSVSTVRENKLKRLVSLDQKVSGQVAGFGTACTEMLPPPVQRADLSHPLIGNSAERGNPVSSPGVFGR